MTRYLVGRLLRAVALLVAIAVVSFVLFGVLPDARSARLHTGFFDWLTGILFHLDVGRSHVYGQSVLGLIVTRLPATVSLLAGAAVVWLLLGFVAAVIAARHRGSWVDRLLGGGALAFGSMPVFWLGLLALYLFASDIGRFPVLPGAGSYIGITSDPGKWFTSLLMPWLLLGATQAALGFDRLRERLAGVLDARYITTARVKGLSERRVVWGHAVRAFRPMVVSRFVLDLGGMLGAIIVVEAAFRIHGVGLLLYQSVRDGDYATLRGAVVLSAMLIVVVRFVLEAFGVLGSSGGEVT